MGNYLVICVFACVLIASKHLYFQQFSPDLFIHPSINPSIDVCQIAPKICLTLTWRERLGRF